MQLNRGAALNASGALALGALFWWTSLSRRGKNHGTSAIDNAGAANVAGHKGAVA